MTERFKPKLTEAQRREIFDEYVKLETASERWGFETRMAEKYSVHRCTIHKITHDPKRVKRYIEGLNHVHDIAMAKLLEAQTDAVCTQVGLMNDVTLPQNLWYPDDWKSEKESGSDVQASVQRSWPRSGDGYEEDERRAARSGGLLSARRAVSCHAEQLRFQH